MIEYILIGVSIGFAIWYGFYALYLVLEERRLRK